MLFGLEITNFLSIRDRQVIDLRVPPNVRTDCDALDDIWAGSRERAPSVVAFFGANAAGKSNVLRALSFVASFVSNSFAWAPGQPFQFAKFLDDSSAQEPTRLVVHFGGPKVLNDAVKEPSTFPPDRFPECAYSYELVIASTSPPVVMKEIMTYKPQGKRRSIFVRDGQSVTASDEFGLTREYRIIDKVLRPDASVISTLAQLNHPFATYLRALSQLFVPNITIERTEWNDANAVQWYEGFKHHLDRLSAEIPRLDVGIRRAFLSGDGPLRTLQFEHEGLNGSLPMLYESHGTRQFVRIFPWISYALEIGGIAVIDELDTSIHPLILPEILGWFSDKVRNPKGATLWMTCQTASLLEDLSKEQIYFCEKDRQGRTEIFGLKDVANVRRVDNFYRKYLGGVYGAIPRVG